MLPEDSKRAIALSELKELVSQSLDADKAKRVEVINLQGQSDIADYMFVASGNSARHVASIATKLIERLAEKGIKQVKAEGVTQGDWVVLDVSDIIVHIFREEVREFYNIEKMWKPFSVVADSGVTLPA